MSITNAGVEVQTDHTAQEQNRHNDSIINKAGAESILPQTKDATTANFKEGKALLAKELKELISFTSLLEADGHKCKQGGNYVQCCCPFHRDSTPSFTVYLDDDTHGKCYGCDWYGDIFKYEMDFHHVDFRNAWARLNDFYYKCPRNGRKAKSVHKKLTPAQIILSDNQKADRKKYAERLATDLWIAEQICLKRKGSGEKWKPETLQKLGTEGSLGWTGDALAFIYPTGTKYRKWPDKDFFWECEGTSLWRGPLIEKAQHIYITESETDAISLIDMGLEDQAGTVVVAAPSATTFSPAWAEYFKDKVVTLCYDNDEAGEKGISKVGPLLQQYASKVLVLDLGRAA